MSTATLDFITQKFKLNLDQRLPIPIPNFGRNQLADLLRELDFKIGVEVGVAAGEYSEILCKANPQMKIYGVDPWKPLEGYRDYTHQSTFDKLRRGAEARLNSLPNYEFILDTSMAALPRFENNSVDFVYIDADHSFNHVANDVHEWLKKLKPGGIISGHDYFKPGNHARIHVVQAVNGYTSSWGIKPWFVLGNEANNEGLIRDMPRSWMWVKP